MRTSGLLGGAGAGTAGAAERLRRLGAAAKLKIPTLGVRTGGFSVGELQEAGVLQVFDSLVAFRHALDDTPLARASR